MVCFTRVTEPVVGKQYIMYSRNIGLQILGTYLENGTFEYEQPLNLEHLCELQEKDGNISIDEIEDFIYTIQNSESSPIHYFMGVSKSTFGALMAKFELKPARAVAPVDPKLLRLRDMLKKI
jgi:hypothetical protein